MLNLNTWGLNWPWSKDRGHRYKALAEIISLSNYDFILLQEVWFRSDYEVIKRAVPYVAHFESFNLWCKWLYFPVHCSGLTILSRHPIVDQDFLPYSHRGSFWNFDGEIFVNKVTTTAARCRQPCRIWSNGRGSRSTVPDRFLFCIAAGHRFHSLFVNCALGLFYS